MSALNFSIEDKLKELGVAIESISVATQQAFEQGTVDVARKAQKEWMRLAQARLRTSAEIYIQGLRQAESYKVLPGMINGITAELKLVGDMPNNFEFGMGPFDMKTVRPGWLGGGKAKYSEPDKDGRVHKYMVIPFSHSLGNGMRGAYTGKAAAITGPDLKTQLRSAAKQYGLDKALGAAVGEVATRRIPNNAPVHPYLQGLQKSEIGQSMNAKGKVSRTSTLTTFRVMSEDSPESAWMHPGIKAANLLQEVGTFVDKELDDMAAGILGR